MTLKRTEPPTPDMLAEAREETHRLLQLLSHYAMCMQMHLEVDDDAVAIYNFETIRNYFAAATRAFEPIRRSFRERIGEAA